METPSYVALSRLAAMRRSLDTLANNVANASTNGYRAQRNLFQEYLFRTGVGAKRDDISMMQDVGQYRETAQGPITMTSNPLDLALNDNTSWLTVASPAQDYYVRTGSFTLDGDGRIVNSQGYALLGDNQQPIVVPPGARDIIITGDGSVTVDGAQVGRLRVVAFADQQAMRRSEGGLYITDQQPQAVQQPAVVQGGLEGSNVQAVLETSRMLELMRDYQATQRLMDNEHERQRSITRIVRNV